MKLDLAVKMIPVVVVFWWVFFLMTDQSLFAHSDYFSNCSFPSMLLNCPCIFRISTVHTIFSAAKPKIIFISLLLYFFLSKETHSENKPNQTKSSDWLCFRQNKRDSFPPDFCFTHMQIILVCPSSSGCNHQGKNFFHLQWKTGLPGARVCSCFTENPKTQKLKILTFSPLPKFAFYFLYLFSF